jgi:3-hydroxyisobutyrate dehydrogenase
MSSGTPALPKVAFLGMSIIGQPMTLRLLQAGVPVTVWNRTAAKCADAQAAGAALAATPAEAAAAADIVLMCVTDSKSVESVVFGPSGLASASMAGKVLVDHSSIRPDATREFARRLKDSNGAAWVDAPVSGGAAGARDGTLAIMAGGDEAAIERVRPVLALYAGNITRMGPVGAGQTTKLCNQIIVGASINMIAEAVRLAQSAGVDATKLPQALAGGWADSTPLRVFVPRMVAPPAQPLGAVDTLLKDIDTALEVGRAAGVTLPVASLVAEMFRMLCAREGGESDPSALVNIYPRTNQH